MLCVIPYYHGDKHLAVQLACWIRDLGGVKNHECLLVIDTSTTADDVIEPLQQAFEKVSWIPSEPAGEQGSWGKGTIDATAPNEMFLNANTHIQYVLKVPYFYMETDCCPMYPAWLDDIDAQYQEALRLKKPFMGAYVNIPSLEPHMTGNAVYPPNVCDHSLAMMVPGKIAWDYAGRIDTVGLKKAHFTTLIQHEYRIHGKEPTFPDQDSLSVIRPETAVFHRCKDGTLIERLRERMPVLTVAYRAPIQDALPSNLEFRVSQLERAIAELLKPVAPIVHPCPPDAFKHGMGDTAPSRTPEQQQALNERMAKARAGRGKSMKKSPKKKAIA